VDGSRKAGHPLIDRVPRPGLPVEGINLYELAALERRTGDLASAERLLAQAESVLRKVGAPHHLVVCHCERSHAALAVRDGPSGLRLTAPGHEEEARVGINTTFRRISAEALEKVRKDPALLDWFLGYAEGEARAEAAAKLGYTEHRPPSLSFDKVWEDILAVLLSVEELSEAHDILDDSSTLPYPKDSWWSVRYYTKAEVEQGQPVLSAIRIDELKRRSEELTDTYGEPFEEGYLDLVLKTLEKVIQFWVEAANAGEALLVYSA
jgi:hypothetical protein